VGGDLKARWCLVMLRGRVIDLRARWSEFVESVVLIMPWSWHLLKVS